MFGGGKTYDCCLEYFAFEVSMNVPKEKNPGKFLDIVCLLYWTNHPNLKPEIKKN